MNKTNETTEQINSTCGNQRQSGFYPSDISYVRAQTLAHIHTECMRPSIKNNRETLTMKLLATCQDLALDTHID